MNNKVFQVTIFILVICIFKLHSFAIENRTIFLALENQEDSAYIEYRQAFNLILGEKWNEAQKKLSEFISKYPNHSYRDDAEYWRAYALKYIEKREAEIAYKNFIENFSKSNYYDDAVADYQELIDTDSTRVYLNRNTLILQDGKYSMRIEPEAISIVGGSDSLIIDKKKLSIKSLGQSYDIVHRDLYRLGRLLSRYLGSRTFNDKKIHDPELQIKIDALYAIGETKKDEQSFQVLRETALDRKNPTSLRETALKVLSEFDSKKVIPIYLEIIKKDTNKILQECAIEYLADIIEDKNKLVEILIELFHAIPNAQLSTRLIIFYNIAEVGNEKAIDFLADIAKKEKDYKMRSEAVYYLGSIGTEKARRALYDILEKK